MGSRRLEKAKGLVFPILIIVFQLFANHYNHIFYSRWEHLKFGWESAWYTLIVVILGAASGIMSVYLACSYSRNSPEAENDKYLSSGIILLFIVGILAVTFKFILGSIGPQVFPFSFLRRGTYQLANWVIYSQVPSFLLGVALGGIVVGRTHKNGL